MLPHLHHRVCKIWVCQVGFPTWGSDRSSVHASKTTPGLTKQQKLSTWPLVAQSLYTPCAARLTCLFLRQRECSITKLFHCMTRLACMHASATAPINR